VKISIWSEKELEKQLSPECVWSLAATHDLDLKDGIAHIEIPGPKKGKGSDIRQIMKRRNLPDRIPIVIYAEAGFREDAMTEAWKYEDIVLLAKGILPI